MNLERTIWKFPLSLGEMNHVKVAPFSKIVLAAIDPASGKPAIWIENSLPAQECWPDRVFLVYATGHPIDGSGGYPDDIHVGSVIDRAFVWHIYERRRA